MIRNVYTVAFTSAALSAGTATAIAQVATPATRRASLISAIVAGLSTTTTDGPIKLQVYRGMTGGAGSTAVTPAPVGSATPASLCTAAKNFTTNPTGGTIIVESAATPVGGTAYFGFSIDEQPECAVSSNLTLVLNSPAAQASGVSITLYFDE